MAGREVEQLKISLQAARDKILATAPPRDGSVLLGLPDVPARDHCLRPPVSGHDGGPNGRES